MEINKKIDVGRTGERLSCEFLIKTGWKILARNHRQKSDEIDIIARADDRTMVFCEVKTLLVDNLGTAKRLMPEDNLTADKLRKLKRACQIFAGKHPELIDQEKGWRIDLVAVELKQDGSRHLLKEIRHYENIA